MKQSKSKVVWGIILVLVAVALIVLAAFPDLAIADVSAWKFILLVPLVYWIINNVAFGRTWNDRLNIFLPIAIILVVFEREIAAIAGKAPETDLYPNWTIIIAAVLLTVALTLFEKKTVHSDDWHKNNWSSSNFYLDASSGVPLKVESSFGGAEVFFQNVDVGDVNAPVYLEIYNRFGSVEVHVPEQWNVESRIVSSMGSVEVRGNTVPGARTLIVTGDNKYGSIELK